ncbi:DUF2254 domain-containing protein [Brevibacterium casei]|uniref:DUF2254 domain-containing protein n=1 Tax=Brevibacterium casei TaxID=33889 RepID=A0AB34XVL6_9MICO|nr:DUF2254 family protein [Brevibacterium casei]KZE22555.1 hypothetical protein AVW13_07700 [Brevibacterium casei]
MAQAHPHPSATGESSSPSQKTGPTRESAADRREWRKMRRHIRPTTMWDVPLRLLIAAVVLGLLTPLVDRGLAQVFSPYPDLDSGSVASLLGIISGAMVTLAGLAFAALTTPMSLGITTMSVRLAPLLQSDRVVQWALGSFVATFVYSLLIALSIALGEDSYKPWTGTVGAVLVTLACAVMFLAFVVRVCTLLNSGALLRRLARDGWKALRFSPDRFHTHAVAVSERSVPDGHLVRRRHYGSGGDALLAVNTPRLLDFEDAWGCTIELVPTVGTPVPVHTLLFRTSEALTSRQEAELEKAVAFGDIESPENGPFGAIRTISDIALKALSPAVNDPSRAVQALDQIEAILIRLSPMIDAQEKELASRPDASVLRDWMRSWAEYVAAATDEIRQFGTTSIQIQRRLRALFADLASICPASQHRALSERVAVLDRGTDRWWDDPLDRRLSTVADPEGIGGAERY